MFGPQSGYEGFPSRSNEYTEDLMSLNALTQNEYANKKPGMQGDSRSLRTDDIPGAKPRSGPRKVQVDKIYSGLSLPSYGKVSPQPNNRPPRPENAQSDGYLKNAANFFGTTPPGSPRAIPSQYKPQPRSQISPNEPTFTNKAAANFYGVTPPQSRVPNQIPPKAVANFYGATPPASRSPDAYYNPKQYSNQYSIPSPNPPNKYSSAPDLPPKAVANFYGVTPPQSRSVYPNPDQNYANPPNNYGSVPGLPPKAVANFYGVTPPQSRSVYPNPNNPDANYPNPPNNYGSSSSLPPKAVANFYGVTPPQSRSVYPDPRRPEANYSSPPNNYGSSPGIPPKAVANFYGVTPPQSRSVNPYSSVPEQNYGAEDYQRKPKNYSPVPAYKEPIPSKEYANFYGATPQISRGNQGVNPGIGQIPPKQLANFYGVTPPPTGGNAYTSNQGYGGNAYLASSNIPAKEVANFYGATPPVSGQQRVQAPDFNVNAAKFFGHDAISPEFQYAADIVNKAPGTYQASPKPYAAIPTRSDRTAHHLVDTAKRIFN